VEQLCQPLPEACPLPTLLFRIVRFFLFLLPAETSHELGLSGLRLLHQCGLLGLLRPALPEQLLEQLPEQAVRLWGLTFPNPVGLAAGLDKNADYLDALGALGFGFVEVGTVTPKPQEGNPKPRLFRLARERAIINRMGFNNKGVDHLVARLQQRRYKGIVGVNIGKNLTTAVEHAGDDYLCCLRKVYGLADYVVVNLSSPNTPGLRKLQFGEHLEQLLAVLMAERGRLALQYNKTVPLLVKIAPDLSDEEIIGIAESFRKHAIDGVIATNTTLARTGVEGATHAAEAGGLSGAPLTAVSTRVLAQLCQALAGSMPVIGVGGITQGDDALMKLRAGAALVQIYSGFIYSGPALVHDAIVACGRRQ